MTLSEIRELANELIALHQLEGWRFRFNKRRTHLGLCRYSKKLIELSIHYAKVATQSQILNTLLHEIAHAIVGHGHAHDAVWKAKAIEVGATPDVCGEVNLKETGDGAKWVAACSCGQPHFKYRKPKHLQGWYCKRPNGSKSLEWKPVD